MKTFLILVTCVALSALAYGQGSPPDKKKKSEQSAEAQQRGPAPKAYGVNKGPGRPTYAPAQSGVGQGLRRTAPTTTTTKKSLGGPDTRGTLSASGRGRSTGGTTAATSTSTRRARTSTFTTRRFNLASSSKPATAVAPAVTFRQGARIAGSQRWTGSSYTVFRNYTPIWHDRSWWHNHYSNIVFVFGGWYYWNSGYWYPAWGYDPNAYYFYDGPIYGYNNLPPDQVIANVQAALQEQGYYQGEVDGILGPLTRAAIARYQEDNGLYATSAIDEPTLAALGMV